MSKRSGAAPQLDMACNGVVLAVDTARISGWAIRKGHKLMYSGEVNTLDVGALHEIVQRAKVVGDERGPGQRGPVLALEMPWGGRPSVVMALGQARERWLAAWAWMGLRSGRVVSVRPASWRSKVLGRGAVRLDREAIRAREMMSAEAECPTLRGQIGPDEAAAICISRWAVRNPKVAAMHGKRP